MGGCICLMASSFFGSDLPFSGVYMLPKKLQNLVLIIYLSKLSLMPSFLVHSIASCKFLSCVFSLPNTCTSSPIPTAPLKFSCVWSVFLWKMPRLIPQPKGILRNLYLPNGVLKVVRSNDAALSFTFQYPCFASNFENK